MLKRFLPNEHVKSVFDIRPEDLKAKGIKGIITDLDNTLVAWDVADATPEIIEWFKLMEDSGIKITIISNNKEERVKLFSEPLHTPFVYSARKPLGNAFKKATKTMGLSKNEVVVIGDQILTDVLGGNSAGFYTILVVPIVQTDGKITRINRQIERRILSWMRRKGMISWEE
ncbi:YqeG family HAD IIIA-type phosphatase [Radiobacillus kanasensis]|uniref:YqeG family HAD IIIA-type phosphatase n=1 Tax=Radiobacillus kanasensis TaxID=2844358 RepID=UPI001E469532|nr:YqeG family HAD IIIA-type phosphatase [Radiobacillus kanasensis]UFT97847.1 YqeG family HAD IIIA-type phosphatase [Radiobacillus kanasensis]